MKKSELAKQLSNIKIYWNDYLTKEIKDSVLETSEAIRLSNIESGKYTSKKQREIGLLNEHIFALYISATMNTGPDLWYDMTTEDGYKVEVKCQNQEFGNYRRPIELTKDNASTLVRHSHKIDCLVILYCCNCSIIPRCIAYPSTDENFIFVKTKRTHDGHPLFTVHEGAYFDRLVEYDNVR